MGTPSEGLEPDEIERRFGWIDRFAGDGTDDSIMKYLLADALIATDGHANADDWAAEWLRRPESIGGGKLDRFFASVLHSAAKLRYGLVPRRVALGNMPSSSSAMSIAPVGIVNAGHPRAAAAQTQEIASLVHIDEAGFCQDGAVAVVACIAVAMSVAGLAFGLDVLGHRIVCFGAQRDVELCVDLLHGPQRVEA